MVEVTSSRRPVREQVFEELAARIRANELPPGTRLVERHVAEELGVSRMSLREAFQLLEAEGLIVIVPRRGAFVARQLSMESETTSSVDRELADDVELDQARHRISRHDARIAAANRDVIERINKGEAVLTGVERARDVIPVLSGRALLHAGPPIEWRHVCGTMRGAMVGAVMFEGWAETAEEAIQLLNSGEIALSPNHSHGCVAPMAGVISPSMAVMRVSNPYFGHESFSILGFGGARSLGMGAHGPETIEKLHWLNSEFAEVLSEVIDELEGIDLRSLMTQGLQMGDELHDRTKAASALFLREVAAPISKLGGGRSVRALEHLSRYEDLFLTMAMAASNVMLMPARGVEYSTVVTTLARNGVDFGIQVAGLGDQWFTAPSPYVSGVFFPGYGPEDADRDIGDSAITETIGLGAFAGAASPLVAQLVGGPPSQTLAITMAMSRITVAQHEKFRIPTLDNSGVPLGVDIRKVVDSGTTPFICTAVSDKSAARGQIGAGVSSAPLQCFTSALKAFMETYKDTSGESP